MKISTLPQLILFLLLVNSPSFAQLQFEDFIFKGYDSPFLDNTSSIAISPDEQHVYVSSFDDDALTLFERDLNSGALSYVLAYKNGIDSISGLIGIHSVLVSPDGLHVYVSAQTDDAISVFERDVITGNLQQVDLLKNGVNGMSGLDGAFKLQSTKDGNYIFMVSPNSNTLSVFKRNVINGKLSLHQQIQDGTNGVNDLTYPIGVALSPNEKNVYVTGFGDNAINIFSRDITSGMLTYLASVMEGQNEVTGMNGPNAVVVSPNGKFVFVSGEQSIVVFQRTKTTGMLTYFNTYSDATDGNYLEGIESFAFSRNGKYLLAASTQDDALTVFEVESNTGQLLMIAEVVNGQNGINSLNFPVEITTTRKTNQMYVAGFGSNALLHFSINDTTGEIDLISSANTASFNGLNGIGGARNICISPNELHAYVAGELDDAITMFERNVNTGMITYLGIMEDGSTSDGLNGVKAITTSSDGIYLYAAGFWDSSITIFERDANTGLLTYLGRVKDGLLGSDGLNGVHDVILSPDNMYLYTAAFLENGIGVFERNTANGMLNYQSIAKDGVQGVDGLSNVIALAISPDGNFLYGAANGEAAIAVFSRSSTDGSLFFVEVIKNTTPGVSGLGGITSISISSDGTHLYASSETDHALVQFDRNLTDGTLSFKKKYQEALSGGAVLGLNGASDVVISPDGNYVYVSAYESNVVSSFLRDPVSGDLEQVIVVSDGSGAANGIGGTSAVNISPDGKFIYATGFNDDAVGIFSCTIKEERTITICEGETYLFGNEELVEAGIYDHITVAGGCTTIEIVHLDVSQDTTRLNVEICTGDAVEVAGVSYMETGIYSHSLTSTTGCDSTVILDLTVVAVFPETEMNETICIGETYELDGIIYEEDGIYEVAFSTAFGCDSTVVLNLNVLPAIIDTISVQACESEFYVFGTSNYIADGSYSHTFTSASGCDSTVLLNLDFAPTVYSQEETICEGESYEFGDQMLTSTGIYEGIVTLNNGCEVSVTLNLIVLPTKSSELYVEICEGDYYVFNNNAYTTTGTHQAIYPTEEECDSLVYLFLTVYPTTTELEANICEGENYTLGNDIFSQSGLYEVPLESYNGCDSIVNLLLAVVPSEQEISASICQGDSYQLGDETFTETGIYMRTRTDDLGCEIEYTLDLEILSVLEVNSTVVDDDGTGIGNITVSNISGGQSPFNYKWSNGADAMSLSGLSPGDYELTVTDATGCYSIFIYTVDLKTVTSDLTDVSLRMQILPSLIGKSGMVHLSIESASTKAVEILLIDNAGHSKNLTQLKINPGETLYTFNAPEIAGIYYVHVVSKEAVKVLKFNVAY